MLRVLTSAEIDKLASRAKVKRIAVENFLGTLQNNPDTSCALANLNLDTRLYKWNAATQKAIRDGIKLSRGSIGV